MKKIENVVNSFVNCTPHAIKLNDGSIFEPSGSLAGVSQTISDFDSDGIAI